MILANDMITSREIITIECLKTPCISDPLYRPRWRPRWVKTAPRPSPLCECCTPLPADILVISPLLGTQTGVKPRSPLSFPRHPHSPLIISQKIPAPRRGKMPIPGPRLPKMIPANSRFYPRSILNQATLLVSS